MDENVFGGIEDEVILPEGGDTLYVDKDMSMESESGEFDETRTEGTAVNDETSADEGPTTADDSEENENGEAGADTPVSDGEQAVERQPRRIKTKFDHKEEYYTLDDMSDDEIATAFQKSKMFDRMTQRESERVRQETYDAQIEAGMTEAVANMIADHAANNYHYQDDNADDSEEAADTKPDFNEELKNFQKKYPNVKEMPTEVMDDFLNNGTPLDVGYSKWDSNRVRKNAAAVEKENKILRQNAATAAKAPVTGVRGGGKITEKADDFLSGLNSDLW